MTNDEKIATQQFVLPSDEEKIIEAMRGWEPILWQAGEIRFPTNTSIPTINAHLRDVIVRRANKMDLLAKLKANGKISYKSS